MHITHQPYDDSRNDFTAMLRLVCEDAARRQDDFIWQPGRLVDWKYGLWSDRKRFPIFFPEHAELWWSGLGDLAGFVVSENGEGEFTVITAPGFASLLDEMLDWVVARWRSRQPGLSIEVRESDLTLQVALLARGFAPSGRVATTRRYDLAHQSGLPIHLPAGFAIVDMQTNGDWRGKRILQVDAFQDRHALTEADLWAYAYARTSPIYDATLDLSIVAADGRHAAGCEGFVDEAHGLAEVERICTHSAFRRRGLAEAVVRSCFQRLRTRGLTHAYITGLSRAANNLYEKLGPDSQSHWVGYVLEGV